MAAAAWLAKAKFKPEIDEQLAIIEAKEEKEVIVASAHWNYFS